MFVNYFAYGSNMSLARLAQRVPSAVRLGTGYLEGHALKFHKVGADGSGKCDACFTGADVRVYGALFRIDSAHKAALDRVEGLGIGYTEKEVDIVCLNGRSMRAFTYCAIRTEPALQPYSWYLNHVLVGARESGLPADYIRHLEAVAGIDDEDRERDALQRAVHG